MKGWLFSFVRTAGFEDDDDRRAAQLLRLVLVVCLASIVGYGLVTIDERLPLSRRVPLVVAFLVAVLCEWGLRRGLVRPQAWVIAVGLTGLSLGSIYTSGGLRSPASLTLFVTVVLSGQLLGWAASLILAALGSLGALYIQRSYELGHVTRQLVHSDGQYARALVIQLMGTGALMAIAAWSLSTTLRRLRREQAAYRELVEEAPDAMASLDANGRMIQVNRAFERMAGRSRQEMLGESFDEPNDAISEQSRREARDHFSRIFGGGSAPLFRFEWTRPDGSQLFAESNARLVHSADGSRHVDLVIRDVSEQVRAERRQQELEEQLTAARKLEAIGQLAGGVAHDFNNLLTVVLGNVQLLRLTRLDEEQSESIAGIEEAAERAAAITRQLLAIGRRQPSRPLSLSLNDAVRGLGDLLRRMVPEHVGISTVLSGGVPNIVADPGQLDQVVLNLVANARDAMPDGGQLKIETTVTVLEHPEQLAPLAPGTYASLRVSDSGLGMNRETQARVFEPFFTTKGPQLGTGLGLATVYGIVKQHGGHIVVESEPGRGSTFSVYFPAAAEQSQSSGSVETAGATRSAKLLLVDDDEAVRRVVATILRRAGHEVTVASDANQALEAAAKLDGLELLISDVVMPGMSGIELSRELLRRLPSLRVLLLSGYPGPHAGQAATERLDYLAKPVTPDVLLTRVNQLLGST